MPAGTWTAVTYGDGRRAMAVPVRVVHHADLGDLANALASTLRLGDGVGVLQALTAEKIRERIRTAYFSDGSTGGAAWTDVYSDAQADLLLAAAREAVLRCYGTPPALPAAP